MIRHGSVFSHSLLIQCGSKARRKQQQGAARVRALALDYLLHFIDIEVEADEGVLCPSLLFVLGVPLGVPLVVLYSNGTDVITRAPVPLGVGPSTDVTYDIGGYQ